MLILIPSPRRAAVAAILAVSASLCAAQSADTPAVELAPVEVSSERPATVATSGALGSRTVLDTPFSLSVIDRAALDQSQSMTLGQAFFGDPSVVADMNPYASGWSSPINVRGVELAWDNYRINGIPTDGWGFEWPFEIIEQVELLKGSGGFMYGFGAPGGIVNYRTKQPLDKPYAATTVGYRSDTVFSAALDVSNRSGKNDWLGYRVNLAQENGGTYNGGHIDRFVGSLALDARVNEKLTLTGELIYLDRRLEDEAPEYGFSSYTGSVLPDPIDGSSDRGVDGTFWDVEYTVASLGLDYQLSPDWKTSVDYSYSEKNSDTRKTWAYVTNTAGDYNLNVYQLGGITKRNFGQALVEGSFETGPVSHQLVAGASWQNSRSFESDYDWAALGSGNLYTGNAVVLPFPAHSTATSFSSEITQTAFFVSDTAEILPGLSLLAGARLNAFKQQTTTVTYRENPVTPTLAVIYKPQPELTLYTSYVESLEKGGTVGVASGGLPYTNPGELLPPIISNQYEIGAKLERTRWTASVALFRLERTAEIDQLNGSPATSVTRVQDGLSVYQGVEASSGYKLTEDLTLTGGVLWLDATYEKLTPASAAFEGNRIAGSPRYQAVLQASYRLPAITGLEVHGGVRYFGDSPYNNSNTLEIPAYTLANLGTSYATRLLDHPVTFRADVSNLTNEKYWSNAGLGPPVTYALSAQVEW